MQKAEDPPVASIKGTLSYLTWNGLQLTIVGCSVSVAIRFDMVHCVGEAGPAEGPKQARNMGQHTNSSPGPASVRQSAIVVSAQLKLKYT